MATGDHEYRDRDQEVRDLQRTFFSGSENYLQNFTRTYAPFQPEDHPRREAELTVANIPDTARADYEEGDLAPEHTKIRWCPEKCAFEVRGRKINTIIPQEHVLKSVIKIAEDGRTLEDTVAHLRELRENILTLVNTCEDDSCEEEKLCDRCIMIKGWANLGF